MNYNFNSFSTINGIAELFRMCNCIANSNCFFYTTRNTQSTSTVLGGAVGGFIQGMNDASTGTAWDGYLVNFTEYGFGLIPLNSTNKLFYKPENMQVELSQFRFINFNQITNLQVKNFSFLNKNLKKIVITLNNGVVYNLLAKLNEKSIPYQNENLSKLVAQYQK